VRGAPADISHITGAQFEKALEQHVDSQGLKEMPELGSAKYEELKNAAINALLSGVWVRGEAENLSLKFTPKQVEDTQEELKEANWPTKKAYEEYLETSHLTPKEALEATELQILETAIKKRVEKKTPPPSEAEIAEYYKTKDRSLFKAPESRGLRLVANPDKTKVEKAMEELEGDHSPANWEKVAKKYSSDSATSSKGGLVSNVVENESLPPALESAIFSEAVGTLSGPFGSGNDWIAFEVIDIKPKRVLTLAEARPMIKATIEEKKPKRHYAKFAHSFQAKWTLRTHCAPDFLVEDCANYKKRKRPE
jgi:hypothetical protein